jgi:coenzyme F420-reducing hydrogenase alpha subunit
VKEMSESEIRMEDLGKSMLQNAQVKTKDELVDVLKKFLVQTIDSKYYLLLSNKLGYYTVFKKSQESVDEAANNIYDFLTDSTYFDIRNKQYVQMSEIKYYEYNDSQNHLEIWVGDEYFQLSDFSWGVEDI